MLDARRNPARHRVDDSLTTALDPIDYSTLREHVARAVARLCPTWLAGQRDDLVQHAVMRLLHVVKKRAADGEGDRPLASSYLYRAAYSCLVDEIRVVRRRREVGIEDHVVAPHAVATDDPERIAASREAGRGIQDCLGCMTRDRRLAVTLYLQGHSVLEASRVLDWPAKRTENLVYRGLVDLRACLMSKGIRP